MVHYLGTFIRKQSNITAFLSIAWNFLVNYESLKSMIVNFPDGIFCHFLVLMISTTHTRLYKHIAGTLYGNITDPRQTITKNVKPQTVKH